MIKSMTGFASLTRDDERAAIGVTIRSVNHRFLDLQLRLPPAIADLEPRLRAAMQKHLARGRVEVSVSLQLRQPAPPQVELNEALAQALASAIEQARSRGMVTGTLTAGDLIRLPQALTIREKLPEAGGVSAILGTVVDDAVLSALRQLEEMRVREGVHLRTDLDTRKSLLSGLIARISSAANTGREQVEARLLERAREIATTLPIDQTALSQEVVRVEIGRASCRERG